MIYFPAFFLILSWFGSRLQGSNINNTLTSWTGGPRAKLEVWPQIVNGDGQKLMLRRKNEPLNMTCTAVYQSGEKNNELLSDYIVDWKVPFHVNNRGTKMERGQGPNVAWLWFERLAEKDAGDYRCMAVSVNSQKQQTLSLNIHLTVKHKIMYCDPRWFKCHSSICIMPRFMCDGKRDCEDGEDESMAAGCGPDPCVGKIYCDERCIPPDWCCDQHNCSANSQLARPEPPTIHPRFGDMSFLQTTMFTIIGCAMAFMFIVTILMIAICRVQMKRAMNSRCSQPMNMTYSRPHHATPLYDLDVYLNRTMDINNPGGVNVMYNINSGVQFVGQPVEPPPYSEVVFVPPREGPPPPYMSYDNLLELPTVQGVSPVTGSNIPLHDNLEALALNHAVNNEGVELTDTGIRRFQSNIDAGNIRGFTAGQVPEPQIQHGLGIFSFNLDDTDGTSSTGFNTSRNDALNRCGAASDRSGSVGSFTPTRDVILSTRNYEPEYVETDALLIENRSANGTPRAMDGKSAENRAAQESRRRKQDQRRSLWYWSSIDRSRLAGTENHSRGRYLANSENEGIFLETEPHDSGTSDNAYGQHPEVAATSSFSPDANLASNSKGSDAKSKVEATSTSRLLSGQNPAKDSAKSEKDAKRSNAETGVTVVDTSVQTLKCLDDTASCSTIGDISTSQESFGIGNDFTSCRVQSHSCIKGDEGGNLLPRTIDNHRCVDSLDLSTGNGNASARDCEPGGSACEAQRLLLPLRESFIGVRKET